MQKLTVKEEKALLEHIHRLSISGFPPSQLFLRQMAKDILQYSGCHWSQLGL